MISAARSVLAVGAGRRRSQIINRTSPRASAINAQCLDQRKQPMTRCRAARTVAKPSVLPLGRRARMDGYYFLVTAVSQLPSLPVE